VLAHLAAARGLEGRAQVQRELVAKKSKSTQVAVLRPSRQPSTPP
jgi:hypothetical protein